MLAAPALRSGAPPPRTGHATALPPQASEGAHKNCTALIVAVRLALLDMCGFLLVMGANVDAKGKARAAVGEARKAERGQGRDGRGGGSPQLA